MIQAQQQYSEIVRGEWQGGFAGTGRLGLNDFACTVSAPSSIGGSGQGTSPSSLLVAAASGCYMLTLAGVLQRRGLGLVSISLETEGVYRGSAPPELHAVIHRPKVVVEPAQAARLDAVRQCLELAKTACMATRAMSNVTFSVEGIATVREE